MKLTLIITLIILLLISISPSKSFSQDKLNGKEYEVRFFPEEQGQTEIEIIYDNNDVPESVYHFVYAKNGEAAGKLFLTLIPELANTDIQFCSKKSFYIEVYQASNQKRNLVSVLSKTASFYPRYNEKGNRLYFDVAGTKFHNGCVKVQLKSF
jgi:hypothetical protein